MRSGGVDFTIYFNVPAEDMGIAVVDHLAVIVPQFGYPAGLDESRTDNSDEAHAPASLVSGFAYETQLA